MKRKKKTKKSVKREKLTSQWSTKKPMYLEKTDKRYKHCLKQLKKQGFCYTETWNLGYIILEFALPRLKMFKEIVENVCHPAGLTQEEWEAILDKIIFALEWALSEGNTDDRYFSMSDEEKKEAWIKYEEGMKLFNEWVLALWW